MKKLSFYALGAGLLLTAASCSNEMPEAPAERGDLSTNFISVNILNSVGGGTRAAADAGANGNYENGLVAENEITKVRLYFLNNSNGAFPVTADGKSYVDTNTFTEGTGEVPNVAKVISVTSAVEVDGQNFPSQVIAVLNPPTTILTDDAPSLSELNQAIADYNITTSGNFVMSNSVYATGVGTSNAAKNETVAITVDDFYTSPGAAEANPINIYVERVVSKVTLEMDLNNETSTGSGGETLYNTGTVIKLGSEDIPVYVKLLGWNVTSTTNKSYLMKEINPGWDPQLFGTNAGGTWEPWNYENYFRSFWAVNPSDVEYNYYNFGQGATQSDGDFAANANKDFTGVTPSYLQENAANDYTTGAGANHPSQVIIAAQLCNSQGTALPFANWAFGNYTISGLSIAFANSLANSVYYMDNGVKTSIDPKFITFVTAGSLNPNLMNYGETGRYYVYGNLTEAGEQETWVDAAGESLEPQEVNEKLQALGHAMIWNNGYTYYYFDIRHLGATATTSEVDGEEVTTYGPGYFGNVRNHVYKTVVNTIVGIGTPVWNPNEEIIPEKPNLEEDTYIAAVIKVLTWRIVNQSYELEWPI